MTKADREILNKLNDTIISLHKDVDALRAELNNVKESKKKYKYVVKINDKVLRFSSDILYTCHQDCINYGGLFKYYEITSFTEMPEKDEIKLYVYEEDFNYNIKGRVIDLRYMEYD